jgi:hypothetical protein
MSASMDTTPTIKDDLHKNGGPSTGAGSRIPGNISNKLIDVQPPKREDLQPSYAQMLGESDTGAHGWYGSMSKSSHQKSMRTRITTNSKYSRYIGFMYWNNGCYSLLRHLS